MTILYLCNVEYFLKLYIFMLRQRIANQTSPIVLVHCYSNFKVEKTDLSQIFPFLSLSVSKNEADSVLYVI